MTSSRKGGSARYHFDIRQPKLANRDKLMKKRCKQGKGLILGRNKDVHHQGENDFVFANFSSRLSLRRVISLHLRISSRPAPENRMKKFYRRLSQSTPARTKKKQNGEICFGLTVSPLQVWEMGAIRGDGHSTAAVACPVSIELFCWLFSQI